MLWNLSFGAVTILSLMSLIGSELSPVPSSQIHLCCLHYVFISGGIVTRGVRQAFGRSLRSLPHWMYFIQAFSVSVALREPPLLFNPGHSFALLSLSCLYPLSQLVHWLLSLCLYSICYYALSLTSCLSTVHYRSSLRVFIH